MELVRQSARPPSEAGVLEFTSAAQLRQHYSSLRKRLHPDRYPGARRVPQPQPPPTPEPELEAAPEPETEAEPEPDPSSCEPVVALVSRNDLILAVSEVTQIPVNVLRSPRRHRDAVKARFVYYALARVYTSASLPQIGRAAGNRDHSTVLHGIRRAAEMVDEFFPYYVAVCSRLGLQRPTRAQILLGVR